ncbi:EscT/YscT/HrcT family type III secretion system export apparatus protein [Exilibacterium tricleocarpae]|uniref:EscT/YscT/HrcT family type III secretion system export apparatus protein n=1 Tax=Exilibacterium tricleocarpae TaxID=2591008 RepID=A0A545U3N0_9GAMM|nr:type III secretion system export apparatus subunit SctT [Exilibacterium tricleocarpae]TQV84085.1 EscT/YscT/HrcT family type III secretion system export apparatus protein [Exilibacterium tricleocarpae]
MDQVLFQNISQAILSLALAMPRIHLALLFVPAMGLKEVRGLLKTAIVISVAMPIAAKNYYTVDPSNFGPLKIAFIMLKEAGIGMVIGFLLSLPFHLFLSIGAIIDNQRGATSGQMFDPSLGSTTLLGSFMQKTFVVLIIEAGLFATIFMLVIETYIFWPISDIFPKPLFSGEQLVIEQFSDMTQKIMLYVLPVLVVTLLVDLAFAIIGLFSPQLQVFFLSMPAKSLVSLLALAMYAGSLWYYGMLEVEAFNNLKASLNLLFFTPFSS